MKLQDQVCTLEQAKKLNEIGIEQCLSNMWYVQELAYPQNVSLLFERDLPTGIDAYAFCTVAAYTVAELGVALGCGANGVLPDKFNTIQFCEWSDKLIESGTKGEAILRAEVLIYALENNITTAAEVNERLKAA